MLAEELFNWKALFMYIRASKNIPREIESRAYARKVKNQFLTINISQSVTLNTGYDFGTFSLIKLHFLCIFALKKNFR